MTDLVKRLRERTQLRYMGDCKCGHCQLVHIDLVYETADTLAALLRVAQWAVEYDGGECLGDHPERLEFARAAIALAVAAE